MSKARSVINGVKLCRRVKTSQPEIGTGDCLRNSTKSAKSSGLSASSNQPTL